MYGLEVCKSLNLPKDFLDNAHNIRMKYHPESGSILEHKGSHFNAKHITGGMCEKCKINPAVDVHHLVFQNEADQNGIIKCSFAICSGRMKTSPTKNRSMVKVTEGCCSIFCHACSISRLQ